MKALKIFDLSQNATRELDCLYRTTRDAQLRTRVHMVLLAVEKGLIAAEIAEIVRTDEQTVRRWLKRYQSQGLDGLYESPRPGCPRKVTAAYLSELMEVVRQKPTNFQLPFTSWTHDRLADFMAQKTGIAVNPETVRLHLRAAGIILRDACRG
jgi:transposase